MSELVKGRASCHKTLLQMAVLSKVKSALCAASQLLKKGSLMWKMLLHLNVNQNPMMMIEKCKNEEDPIKNGGARVLTRFPH